MAATRRPLRRWKKKEPLARRSGMAMSACHRRAASSVSLSRTGQQPADQQGEQPGRRWEGRTARCCTGLAGWAWAHGERDTGQTRGTAAGRRAAAG
uniref:Uncharacterized protein n=1 Tax=Aegilops tauschii TaxID=37682 RepID=M8B7H3_AEGTA